MLGAAWDGGSGCEVSPGGATGLVCVPVAQVLCSACAVLQCLPTAHRGCRTRRGMPLLGNVWSVVFLTPGTTTTNQKLLFLSLYQKDIFLH